MKRKHLLNHVWIILSVVIIAIYVFPYLYLVLTSFKTPNDVISTPPTLFPKKFSLENYLTLRNYPYLPSTFLYSLIIATLSTIFSMLIAIPAAYGITRYNTKYGQLFLVGSLFARLIPYISVAIPLFFILKRLSLIDTYPGVIIGHMTVILPFSIWLLSSFFEGIPVELEEAARIDGCTRIGAFVKVIVPVVSGGIGTTAIFGFLASWNDFLFSLMLTSTSTKTVPLAIAEFNSQHGMMWGSMTSLATLFSLPVIIVSFFFQKRLIAGATMGAVKG